MPFLAVLQAFRRNTSAVSLELAKCEIGDRGTMMLADMLQENSRLKYVVLSKNPIGQRGGRAILRAIRETINA